MKRLKSEKVEICYSQSFKKQNSMKILSILSKLMKPLPWGGVWGGCLLSKLMKPLPWGGVWGGFFLLALASCSGGDDDAPRLVLGEKHTVSLFLSVPAVPGDGSRIGDPGEAVGEGEDWDKMAIMIVYADGQTVPDPVDVRYLSIEDFTSLPDAGNGYKRYSLDVYEGDVYIYGVTYSGNVNMANGYKEDFSTNIENVINACDTKADVEALIISNEYATKTDDELDVAKFLSVATGYYHTGELNDDGVPMPAAFHVTPSVEWSDSYPKVNLLRLAAKIDIQWDAADAYPSYTGVKVTYFTFYYNKDASDPDKDNEGNLFPGLSEHKNSHGYKKFYNISAVSQRNGRVYHYAFPDGQSRPEVTFTITADGQEKKDYKFTFTEPLQKATWYKINTAIKGLTGTTDFDITFEGPDNYGYPEYE